MPAQDEKAKTTPEMDAFTKERVYDVFDKGVTPVALEEVEAVDTAKATEEVEVAAKKVYSLSQVIPVGEPILRQSEPVDPPEGVSTLLATINSKVEFVKAMDAPRKTLKDFTDQQVINAARTAHEVNRAYCAGLGDVSQKAWDDAEAWQRISAINGVEGVIAGNGPEQSHESWLKEKEATGWKYGPVKDATKKEHPCFVSYYELPDNQKFKDALFINSVRGVLGLTP